MGRTLLNSIDWSSVGLGTAPDRAIACKIGVHFATIAYHRNRLKIPSFGLSKRKIDWTKIDLGTKTDTEIAKELGTRRSVVLQARKRNGVQAFDCTRSPKGIDWDQQPLGKTLDSDLAKKLGVATPIVYFARQRRRIPSFKPRAVEVDWENVCLGRYPDEVVAASLGVSQATVSRHRSDRNIPPHKHLFYTQEQESGNYPECLIDLYWHKKNVPHKFQVPIGPYIADWVIKGDTVVEYAGWAEHNRLGVEYRKKLEQKVRYYEEEGWKVQIIWKKDLHEYDLGEKPTPCRDPVSKNGINWALQPLGKVLDASLAKELGVLASQVSYWRRRLGIPAWRLT